MSTWRRLALEHFPEFRREFEAESSLVMVWLELRVRFHDAYDQEPPDRHFIRRVYAFADALLFTGSENATDTIVCFYESLADPAHPKVREDRTNFLDTDFVCSAAMRHHISYDFYGDQNAYEEYLRWFLRKKLNLSANEAECRVTKSRREYELVRSNDVSD